MVAPALTAISAEFGIKSELESSLVLSIFILAYAIGPLFLGPLSEMFGRVIVLQLSNLFYLFFNLGCGLAKTKGQMIAFRFLSGLGGSAPLALGGGVLSDLFTAEQRGKAISIYSLMPLLGPALGPIAGGFVTENTTWRWVFYATTIADALIQICGLFFLQETYPPVLLHRKKKKLIKETGNEALHTEFDRPDRTIGKPFASPSSVPSNSSAHKSLSKSWPSTWRTSTDSCISSCLLSLVFGKTDITNLSA
jgi:multidrug resistance protein